ncbi:MAG: hypothetical protein WBO58_10005 [Gammaproteobacteria bacterium]
MNRYDMHDFSEDVSSVINDLLAPTAMKAAVLGFAAGLMIWFVL